MLDAKGVTQLNSVRVSFANRIENGGSFAKQPARAWVSPRWASVAPVGHGRGPRRSAERAWEWAAPFGSGPREEEFSFHFPANY